MQNKSELGRWKLVRRNMVLGALFILALLIATTAVIAATRKKQKIINTYSVASQESLTAEPKLVPKQIAWPARETINEEARRRLATPQLEKIDASLLPVLLPDLPEVGQGSFLTNSYGYSFSIISSSHYSMVIYAFSKQYTADSDNRTKEATNTIKTADRVRGQAAIIGESEGIWRAEWEEFGARYLIHLSCEAQIGDQDCKDKLSSMLQTMTFVGGNFGPT
jgi:hypothetical protein